MVIQSVTCPRPGVAFNALRCGSGAENVVCDAHICTTDAFLHNDGGVALSRLLHAAIIEFGQFSTSQLGLLCGFAFFIDSACSAPNCFARFAPCVFGALATGKSGSARTSRSHGIEVKRAFENQSVCMFVRAKTSWDFLSVV